MRVLVVEDSPKMSALLRKGLERERYAVDVAGNGRDAVWMGTEHEYDVIVLDIVLDGAGPYSDGFEVCAALRKAERWTPVLMVTARDAVQDRVRGLDVGADDYLAKPFAFEELLARVRALVRRGVTERPAVLSVGDLLLDPATRHASRASEPIALTPTEFALLEYLMRNAGRVVSKTMILSHVWEYSFDPQTNIVDVLVSRLRERIDRPFDRKLLQTVRGVGYVLGEHA